MQQGKPHKHAEVIKAWADGKQIQVKAGDVWLDLTIGEPNFRSVEYRVKPEETIRYRVALIGRLPSIVYTKDDAIIIGNLPTFIRWLTNWVEVEV